MSSVVLYFGSDQFPLYKGSYSLSILNKESESETEAGTIVRDIKRLGVPQISVSQTVTQAWYQTLYNYYVTGAAVTITYFSPATLAQATFSGYIKDLKFNLINDTSTTDWDVSFEVKSY